MDDELIIKRKLIFDGEGLGDERRLIVLQKMIARWIFTNNSNIENQSIFNKICSQLSALEYSRQKSDLIKSTYQKEFLRYQCQREELEENISNVKNGIETSKILLLEVKNSKQQKLNYDMIAKDITAEPSRGETARSVRNLQNNLIKMKKTEAKLNDEWSVWRKHCSVIIKTATQLNDIIEKKSSEF